MPSLTFIQNPDQYIMPCPHCGGDGFIYEQHSNALQCPNCFVGTVTVEWLLAYYKEEAPNYRDFIHEKHPEQFEDECQRSANYWQDEGASSDVLRLCENKYELDFTPWPDRHD